MRALGPAAATAYVSRRPETTTLYGVVQHHPETWLAHARARGRSVPAFVEREFREFLDCGIAANGFLRLHCDGCGLDRVVPFSCKGRGFCPSCGGRHMADTSTHLVDRVLPRVPVRQWVLSLPFGLRYRLAHDRQLTADVLRVFVRAIFASVRRRSRTTSSARGSAHGGAVTYVQRFGGALNLNVHFHSLVLDGAYRRSDADGPLRFHAAPPPTAEELGRVLNRVVRGMPANDRRRLERLCRYAGRPPVASERLSEMEDGRLLYGLRHRWKDGTTHVAFEPLELIDRLAALVPPPRFHTVRYHGLLASRSKYRAEVVPEAVAQASLATDTHPSPCDHRSPRTVAPGSRPSSAKEAQRGARSTSPRLAHPSSVALSTRRQSAGVEGASTSRTSRPSRYYSWSELMRRVFEVDVLRCPRCNTSPMRILAAIHPPTTTAAILKSMGLPTRAPPVAPARSVSPNWKLAEPSAVSGNHITHPAA